MGSDGADVSCCGRLFQIRTAAIGKLGHHRLRVEYEEQTAREMKRNADALETPTLLDDEVHRRDMTVPGHEDIYRQERPA